MKTEEVFKEITTPKKWYVGYCKQSYASQLKQRFEDGRLSEKSLERLFKHFGYVVARETEWTKNK